MITSGTVSGIIATAAPRLGCCGRSSEYRSSGGEYAGGLAVDAIDDKVMREFIPWRRDYYAGFKKLPKNAKRYPADRTTQFDMMIGKAIVRWAGEEKLRGNQPAITATFTLKKKRVRPAFELSEFRILWRVLCRRINTATDKRTKRSGELLRQYILVIANSGLRPGEAHDLNVRDVHPFKNEKGRSNYRFVVRGKSGRARCHKIGHGQAPRQIVDKAASRKSSRIFAGDAR